MARNPITAVRWTPVWLFAWLIALSAVAWGIAVPTALAAPSDVADVLAKYHLLKPEPAVNADESVPEQVNEGLLAPVRATNSHSQIAPMEPGNQASAVGGLLGPFTWTNEPPTSASQTTTEKPAPATNNLGQTIGLLGPLQWRNEPEQASKQMLATAADSDVQLTQGEENAGDSGTVPEIIPIPSGMSEPKLLPNPDVEIGDGGTGDKEQGENDSLSGAESLGEEPPEERLQFLRTDTVLLEPGEMQFDIGITYQLFENRFTVVDSGSNLVEARVRQRQLAVPMEIRYGVTRRAQFFIGAPVGWSNTEFATEGFSNDDNTGGLGDTTLGMSFVLFDNPNRTKDTIFTIATTLPTGDDPFASTLVGQPQPSLGQGFWALSTDLLCVEAFDPVVVFCGIGYRHQFESNFRGVDIRPGDEFRALLGVGFAVNKSVTLSTRFNASYFTRTQFNGNSVPDSLQEPMSIRFAATIAKCNRFMEPFVDVGTTPDAAATRFGVIWTY